MPTFHDQARIIIFCTLGFICFSTITLPAQEQELAGIRIDQASGGSDRGVQVKSIIYFQKFESAIWSHSLAYKERILENEFQSAVTLKSYAYSGFVRIQNNSDWSPNFFYNLAISRFDNSLNASAESVFSNLLFLYSQNVTPATTSSWSFGLIYINQTAPTPLFPLIAYQYQDLSRRHRLRLGYPSIDYRYSFSENTKLSLFAKLDRESAFSDEQQVKTKSELSKFQYIRYERLLSGLLLSQRLKEKFFLQYSIAHSALARVKTLNKDFDVLTELSRPNETVVSLGISLIFEPNQTY